MQSRLTPLFAALLLAACAPRAQLDAGAAPPPRLPGMTGSAFASVNGERVYYEVGGAGSPVLLVHGVGGGNSGFQWRRNTEALAREHTVYVLDLPGFGRSPAEAKAYTGNLYANTISAFLGGVVGRPAAVVASSLGAAYTVTVAAQRPALVTRMLLVSPSGLERLNAPPNQTLYRSFVNGPVGPAIAAFLRTSVGVNYFLNNQVYLNRAEVTPDVTRVYVENLASANKEYPVYAFIAGWLNDPLGRDWPTTTQPASIVWGSDDVNTPASGAAAFQRLRPDVPVVVLPGRAIPNDESAERFNALALAFLH